MKDTTEALARMEQADLDTLALWNDWHYLSPVVCPGYRLERLERLGLIELQWRGGGVWSKRYGRLTDKGRARVTPGSDR